MLDFRELISYTKFTCIVYKSMCMENYVGSEDGVRIHYKVSGQKPDALVFVHGWLGNAGWWDYQKEYFKDRYTVVQIDLPGHGRSGAGRTNWSSANYAADIKAVVNQLEGLNVALVGHSMSGPYCLEASLGVNKVKLVVLVDTLKNMDQLMNYSQAEELLLSLYSRDFAGAVEIFLPKFLREIASQVAIPVRAVNSDFTPTEIESIRKYIKDFDFLILNDTGHYPMLEKPEEFNRCLSQILEENL